MLDLNKMNVHSTSIVLNDLEDCITFAEDVKAVFYCLYADMYILRGSMDKSYRVLDSDGVRALTYDEYRPVLYNVPDADSCYVYINKMDEEELNIGLCYSHSYNSSAVIRTVDYSSTDNNHVDNSTKMDIIDYTDWTEEHFFQQSLVLKDYELRGLVLLSALKYDAIPYVRIDICHMMDIIQNMGRNRLNHIRSMYSSRTEDWSTIMEMHK